ncbi:hypothetical protein H310_01351 [Aphanomyces invadans]|uniref:PPPDE domain-containing protein n=1 Tax=Aphanomyces invadans TaxID=157072 RepID=A0A024UT75_9STRA|nr:hypothetical protein H310_01351 [Aphanomyces invadans]ETW08848.1 hypothetical protein H310_01351 [Aphanomyces invadans]|eukprot:XP_008862653.1 hypothetical protein H310_01351 [Aphanomyces invadans]
MRRQGLSMKGKTTVTVNVYDIVESNSFTYAWGLGAFHSGVEVGGVEYSFAGGAGVFTLAPKSAQGAVFRESIQIGVFEGTYQDAKRILDDMRSEFNGSHYNLLTKNCNTFANEACLRLVGQPIPAYINRIAYLGSCFSCLIPKQLTGEAPVQGSDAMFGGFSHASSYGTTSVPVFAGAPAINSSAPSRCVLGAGQGLALNSNSSPSASLLASTDENNEAIRREKRVAAALKRLEKRHSGSEVLTSD